MLAEGLIVAPIVAVMGAFMVLLFLYAAELAAQPLGAGLAALLELVPGVGDDLARAVRASVHYFAQWLSYTAGQLVTAAAQPLIDTMNTVANNVRVEAWNTRWVQMNIVAQLNQLTAAQRMQVSQAIVDWTRQQIVDSESRTDGEIQGAVDASEQYTRDSYTQLSDWAGSAVRAVAETADATRQQLAATASTLEQNIEGVRDVTFQAISATARETIDAADQHIEGMATVLRGEAVTEHNVIDTFITDTRDYVIDRARDDLAPVAAVVAGTTALLGTRVLPAIAELEDFNENCAKPVCNNLLDFARGFGEIAGLLATGALIGFFAAAIANPDETAAVVARESESLLAPAFALAQDVFHLDLAV